MHKLFLAVSSAALAVVAIPATATIQIFDTPGAVQPAENVLFQAGVPVGNTAFGITNSTGKRVTFVGIEQLLTPSSGQARLTTADGGLSQISFGLDMGYGFTAVEFNIFGTGATATQTTLSFTDQFGTLFTKNFAINNGQNFFSAVALDNQFISNVSIFLNGNVRDIRQFRLGGVGAAVIDPGGDAVPEPESWAMLIAGLGFVGFSMRRRNRLVTVAS